MTTETACTICGSARGRVYRAEPRPTHGHHDDCIAALRADLGDAKAIAKVACDSNERLRSDIDAAIREREELRACNDAMREPMRLLRDAAGLPAQGESVVINTVVRERNEMVREIRDLRTRLAAAGKTIEELQPPRDAVGWRDAYDDERERADAAEQRAEAAEKELTDTIERIEQAAVRLGLCNAGDLQNGDGLHYEAIETISNRAARADAAEKERDEARAELAVFKQECAQISKELDLPPTLRPCEGEFRRMRADQLRCIDIESKLRPLAERARSGPTFGESRLDIYIAVVNAVLELFPAQPSGD